MKVKKSDLNRKIERQESRIDRLVGMLAKKGFYDKSKKLDQSIFNDEPPHLRWAAIEEDGSVYLFAKKPFIDLCKWAAAVDEVEVYIGDDYDASNWQNSLIERDIAKELLEVDLSSELTGSELVRAMLERGDRCVMCMVANNEANMFLATRPVVVHGCTDSDFISVSGYYSFAVAVNNQGEPLTAAEAGF